MPRFAYLALNQTGTEVRGTVDGPNAEWVGDKLRADSLIPIEVEDVVQQVGWIDQIREQMPVGIGDISLFSSQFALMLNTGLPILTALDLLADNSTKLRLRQALTDAIRMIREGSSLHAALDASGQFPSIYINMVKAGETSGQLAEVLEQLSVYLNREAELRGKVKKALAYPIFLVVLAFLITTFLVVAIIPKFAGILEDLGVPLPLPTQILLATSSFMVGHWPWIILAVAAAGAGSYFLLRIDAYRRRLDFLLLRLPLVGELISKNGLARFCYVLGSLLAGGIPIVDALEVARVSAGNRRIAEAIAQARREIMGGRTISEALGATGDMPSLILQMVAIGETTGSLDQVLTRVAEIYDQQVDRLTHAMVALIEPVLIVVLGVVVGFIALSLVLPMVKAVTSIG